jgi:lambda family phage portal protein
MFERVGKVYDEFLMAFAPSRALHRQQARFAARTYEAATQNARLRAPNPYVNAGTGDVSIANAGLNLTYQARYLDENYDIAHGILNDQVNKIVGVGISTKPIVKFLDGTPAIDINKELKRLHKIWSQYPENTQELNYGECQRLACRTWLRDGEIFVNFLAGNIKGLLHASTIQLTLNYLETDFCPFVNFIVGGKNDSKVVIKTEKGNSVFHGIEVDVFGRVVAYHFYKTHPNDPFVTAQKTIELIRVPTENVAHLFNSKRLNQKRGVTIFHSVINRLRDVKEYDEAESIAARIAAAMGFQIVRDPSMANFSIDSTADRQFVIKPGMNFDNLMPGERVETITANRPNPQLEPFRDSQLRAVAAGTNSSFSSIAKNYNRGSYSSQRQESNEQRAATNALREIFINQHERPIYKAFVQSCIAQRLIQIPSNVDVNTLFDAEFRGPGMERIDAKAEVAANIAAVEAGFKSRQSVILENGEDPDEIINQLIEERANDLQNNLKFSTNLADTQIQPNSNTGIQNEEQTTN